MGKRILIVDDESRVAFFLKEGLQGMGIGYEVHTTGSAEVALEQARQQPFDLVVIDYRLPGLNGLDLMERLHRVSPDTQTILITAYSSPEIEHAAYKLHARQFFAKPFHIQDFMWTVKQMLGGA